MPVKVFTLEEVNNLLPLVQRAIRTLQESVGEIIRLQDALSVLEVLGGGSEASPEHDEYRRKQNSLETVAASYNAQMEYLQKMGCVLKDLNHGVVDFYGLREGRLVFFCWRMGEPAIGYWHEINSGMAGRRPVAEL